MKSNRRKVTVIEVQDLAPTDGDGGDVHTPQILIEGLPAAWPNLWLMHIAGSLARSSLNAYARDVAILYERVLYRAESNWLREIKSAGRCSVKYVNQFVQALSTDAANKQASSSTCHRRKESVSGFFEFVFDEINRMTGESMDAQALRDKRSARFIDLYKKRMILRASSDRAPQLRAASNYTAADIDLINKIIEPGSNWNPVRRVALQYRNFCMFHLGIEAYARSAEIALFDLNDLDLGAIPRITVKRAKSAVRSHRKDGASLKTRGRVLEISPNLAHYLAIYESRYRPLLINRARPTSSFFLSGNDGLRLSRTFLNSWLSKVQNKASELTGAEFVRLHPHGLRKTQANRHMATNGASFDELMETLRYAAGWSEKSKQPAAYARAAILDRVGLPTRLRSTCPPPKVHLAI